MRIRQLGKEWLHDGGQWLNRHSNVRMGLIIFSIITIIISLIASDRLVTKMANEERIHMEIWANATQALNADDINTTLVYLSRITKANPSIPSIMTDYRGNILGYKNIDLPDDPVKAKAILQTKLEDFRRGYPPLAVPGLSEPIFVYYSDSSVVRLLHLFPYTQVVIFLLFIGVAVTALVSLKKSDQNRIWEGLARETAHQLGTPTSSLMAWKEYLETLEVDPMITKEMEKDIERLGIIADRFQKIGSTPNLKSEDLHQVLMRSLRYMEPRISKQVSLHPPTRLTDEALVVRLSEPLLAWVFENLIKNAVDAMDGQGSITFAYQLTEDLVTIDVTDTGKGIPKNKQKAVFRPGVSTRKRGWGLGLSLAKRIVEEYHGGRIYVKHSELGVGTTFRIELKREQD